MTPTSEEVAKARGRMQTALDLCSYRDFDAPVTVEVGDLVELLAATEPQEPHEPPAGLVEAVRGFVLQSEFSIQKETVAGIARNLGSWLEWALTPEDLVEQHTVRNASEHDLQAAIEQVIRERSEDDETE